VHVNSHALEVCSSQDSSFLISILYLVGRWVEFRVFILSRSLTFLRFSIRCRGRVTSIAGIHVSNLRFRVLVRLSITNHVYNVLKFEIVLGCQF
jgi:hypothetical protein